MNAVVTKLSHRTPQQRKSRMAVPEESLQPLRIGDTVLLYAAETKGYVISELAR